MQLCSVLFEPGGFTFPSAVLKVICHKEIIQFFILAFDPKAGTKGATENDQEPSVFSAKLSCSLSASTSDLPCWERGGA